MKSSEASGIGAELGRGRSAGRLMLSHFSLPQHWMDGRMQQVLSKKRRGVIFLSWRGRDSTQFFSKTTRAVGQGGA